MILRPTSIILFLITALFSHFSDILAQSGDFILTHHSPKHSEIDNINFEIISDQHGIICLANRFGVLKYDGQEWDYYKTGSTALSVAVSADNTVYVGCLGEFGKIDYQDNGYQYQALMAEDTLLDHFLQTFILNEYVYYLSDNKLFQYNTSNGDIELMVEGSFYNGYTHHDALYINAIDDELIQVRNGKIDKTFPEKVWGLISSSPNDEYEFAVDLQGGLFYQKDGQYIPHAQYDRLKEAEVVITDLVWVTDSLIACSSFESGVFFLKADDPDYFEVTDYHSGLPDNEIYDIYADENGGVWVAHEFGLTRISPLFPAYSYTNFPGLEGNLIEAQRIHGDLWVNTSLGVYYFSRDTSYQSRVYFQKVIKTPTSTNPNQSIAQSGNEKEEQEEPSKKRKGFLGGLFKKKERIRETEKQEDGKRFLKKIFSGKPTEKEEAEYIRRVERIVTGVTYQFHHVPGSDGKFRQLMETKNKILATSHTGIYEITKESAQLVIDEPVQYAHVIPESNRLLISTERGLVKCYEFMDDIWKEISSQSFQDIILNVYMDSHQLVWLAGTTHIYQGAFRDDSFIIEHSYEINNRFYDELSIWEHSNSLYFINSQGYFRLDRETEHIVVDKDLESELGEPHHHLHNERDRVWMYNGKIWKLLKPDGSIEDFHYLGVFPDLKYINYDDVSERYWLVTEDNQLLAYDASQTIQLDKSHDLFIKRMFSQSGELMLKKNFKLRYNQNTLSIELLKPDYMGFLSPEYQYILMGLNEEWSPWTRANLIDYSYLPPGSYELMVRVRDAMGQLDQTTLLDFEVATPYWQQPWFYGIQVFMLAIIIGITSRLDESKKHNRLVKQGLSILTLVVIIEFLQSVIGGYLDIKSTPVVDFIIDAGIAVMVFPLEWLLRKLILEGGLKMSIRLKKAS